MTIQFPHLISGESPGGGIFPTRLGYVPRHMADPIQRVRVGVLNQRTALEYGATSPKYPPAPKGEPGQINGIGPKGVGSVVGTLKVGIHSCVRNPSPIGIQNTTGSFPGARGAQLTGELKHDPPQNPQARPSNISCAFDSTFFVVS